MNELKHIDVPRERGAEAAADATTALTYRVWPTVEQPRATVGLFNGIMSHSAWFDPLTAPLVEAGFKLVGVDRRGSGQNKDGWGDAASASTLVEDATAVLEAEHDPARPLFLVGWCWGAALSIAVGNHVAKGLGESGPSDLRGIALVTPGMFNRPALHAAIGEQLELHADAEVGASVLDSPIQDTMFTASSALDSFVRADTDRVMTISRRLLSLTKKLATGASIRLRKSPTPTLVVLAEDDEATDNEATQAFFGKLPADRVDVVTVPGRHGVQFDAPQQTSAHLLSFFEGLMTAPLAKPAGGAST